ncbi:MAG TPA: hypothetical protein VFE01_00490 [Terracidiphilus sp.]|jgi:hypothetical protein|nr:hypothetical protein [Terracidiphilus sp.]
MCTQSWARAVLAGALAAGLAGCGTPGAPQPPSLDLPDRVTDLAATRTGNQVALTWTMPRKNTDKLLLKIDVNVNVCRKEDTGPCQPANGPLLLAPGADGHFSETLPSTLSSGAPRKLSYVVELKNRSGRSAGLSNAAVVAAGEAPPPITGLTAEVRKVGVVLRWKPDENDVAIRLHRLLLNPPAAKPKEGLMAPAPEPVEQDLLVEAGSQGQALDESVRFGESYEYRAQRVIPVEADGQKLQLDGEFSQPVRVEVKDVFPPALPNGLAAVASEGENGAGPAIDLSWQPNTETDLAGYIVYRREDDGAWQRISPPQPVVGPAFHDAQVQPGHSYRYAVSAVDQGGHESARSPEAQETVPNP